jgi:methylated-DNA-[protein]-cysteine S-methyltransferase
VSRGGTLVLSRSLGSVDPEREGAAQASTVGSGDHPQSGFHLTCAASTILLPMVEHAVIRHPITDVTIVGTDRLSCVTFGVHRKGTPTEQGSHLSMCASMIESYLDGGPVDLDRIHLDLGWCTAFQRDVLSAARSIPRGTTVSYSDLARASGHPRAVRAAASVMRNNRFPLLVPCHRVVSKGGALGGFMGKTSGSAVALKRRLLALEGISALTPDQ